MVGQRFLLLAVIVVAALALTGCEAIGTIFKAGVWVGIVAVVLVVAIVGLVAAKIRQ